MSQELKDQLQKRVQSLLWRTLMFILAGLLTIIIENVTKMNLAPYIALPIGLVLGEVSKFLNSYLYASDESATV